MREHIEKIIEWHVTCLLRGPGQFPCNFVPLVVGPSGSGKTYTIKTTLSNVLANVNNSYEFSDGQPMHVPFIEIDATQLTAEGWDGLTISDALFQSADRPEDLENAIIYVDEIDKLAMTGDKNHSQHAKMIQSNLLKWIDKNADHHLNIKYRGDRRKVPVSMSQSTWIFSGAFEDIFKSKAIDNKALGFTADVKAKSKNLYAQQISWEDIKKAGLMPELVNRMNILIQTQPYSQRELRKIANASYDKEFIQQILGVNISQRRLFDEIEKLKAGARGVDKALYQQALLKYKLKGEDL